VCGWNDENYHKTGLKNSEAGERKLYFTLKGSLMKLVCGRYMGVMAAIVVCVITLFPAKNHSAETDERKWSVFAYGGQWSDNPIGKILLFQTKFENSYVWAAGISRKIIDITDDLLIEAELGAARHTGLQDHFELNASFNLRWHNFPWDNFVNTSIAYGLGPSYANRRPPVEESSRQKPAHVLVFMPLEITLAPPKQHNLPWEFIVRVHHRSGAFGVVSDAKGSNFVTVGLRYRF
jgi:hypothetical protein